jgi:hypothetical protein
VPLVCRQYLRGTKIINGPKLAQEHLLAGAAARVRTHAITVTGGSTANCAITDMPGTLTVTASTTMPPPLVTMTTVHPVTNKKHLVTQILVSFSGAVNAGEADNLATYRLARAGKKGSFTAKSAQAIKLKSAVYNPATDSVTLTPKKAFALTKPVQLVVDGVPPSRLQDSFGRFIDGDHNDQAGGKAVAILSRGGVALDAVAVIHSDRVQAIDPYALDILLEREQTFALRPLARAAHSSHHVAAR